MGQPKIVIPPSRSSLAGLDSSRSDRGGRFQESNQLRNALIKAIAHSKAEPIKACVFKTSNPGADNPLVSLEKVQLRLATFLPS